MPSTQVLYEQEQQANQVREIQRQNPSLPLFQVFRIVGGHHIEFEFTYTDY